MKIYSDRFSFGQCLMPGWEFEVLNEMKNDKDRTALNCSQHTRFLFEMDDTPLDEQIKIIKNLTNILVRVVYSGSKSYHCIVEFDPKYEKQCENMYREIWDYINTNYFQSLADEMCANPNRLTRIPNVKRADTGKKQELIFKHNRNYYPFAKEALRWAKQEKDNKTLKLFFNPPRPIRTSNKNNGRAMNKDKVKYYLNTPFPLQHGNGNSNSSLFTAMSTCFYLGDQQTLDAVIAKAKSEGWTDKEIQHNMNCITKGK